ncbi:MAG TPA: tetratricopeptide repeat protein [Polyangia bacterium]
MSDRQARVPELTALAALLLFVAGRCLVPMDETDLFFNVRLGDLVLAQHAVPRTNLLSFTWPDARDLNLAWLFQVLLALTYRAGGIAGTVLLKTAFVLATWALLFRVALRRGAHPAAAAAALALAAWAAEPRFVERPHLVTFLGLGYLLLALERAERGRPRALYALVALAVVWANANSCFFLAPALLALYAAGAALDRRGTDARRAGLVAVALVPFIFATPSGAGALGYIANHWRMPALRPLQEYRTASWPLDGPFFLVAGGTALALALPGRRRRWRQVLPALALALLGARRIRFVAEFSILAGPMLAVALSDLGRRARHAAPALAGSTLTIAVTAALAGATLVPRVRAVQRGERFVDLGLEPELVPAAAIRFVDDNGLGDRMYNDLEVGSYLTWHWAGRHRVFQDPRINSYPRAFHATLRRDDLTRPEWEAFLARFGVTTALVTYPDVNPRAALFDPGRWALVYRDAEALVFAARRPSFSALVGRDEIPMTFAFTRAAGVTAGALTAEPPGSPVSPCDWQKRLGDVAFELGDETAARTAYAAASAPGCLSAPTREEAAIARGDLALKNGDAAGAVEAYTGVADPRARANRGLALLSLGRPAEAEADLTAALAAEPNQPEARLAQGFAFEALGRLREAAASFRAFLTLAPSSPAAGRARAEIERLGR